MMTTGLLLTALALAAAEPEANAEVEKQLSELTKTPSGSGGSTAEQS